MIKVFVVEDNDYLLEDIVHSLKLQGYDCYGATDALTFDELLAREVPDLVILDWNLPGEDGLSIAERLHANDKTNHVGIIFLTARGSLEDRIAGLELADAYLTKPIDYQELGSIITSINRRLAPNNESSVESVWKINEKTLELNTPQNKILSLSYREYIALYKLAESPGIPVSAQKIVEAWGENWLRFEKNRLELLLSRLRRKIKDNSNIKLNPIRSVRNEGYHLMIPIEIITHEQFSVSTEKKSSNKTQKSAVVSLSEHAYDLSPNAIMITGCNQEIIRTNTAFSEVTGYAAQSVLGKNPRILNSGRHGKTFYQLMWHSINTTGTWSGEIYNRRRNGQIYLQNIKINALHNSAGDVENYIAIFSDITQEREQELQLKHLSNHDALTGLANRRLLHQQFDTAVTNAKRQGVQIGLLFIDLNGFKPVNDKFGHSCGDFMLQEIASRILSCVRETDTVARLGGDEFVVLMTNIDSDNATATDILRNKLKKIIAHEFIFEGNTIKLTASIGISIFPEQGTNFETLCNVADMAMYKNKEEMKLFM